MKRKNLDKLYYWGTEIDVQQGDHIVMKSLFGRKRGRVAYIPKKSASTLTVQKKEPDDWLIEFEDGTFTGWMYYPEELQPSKKIVFVHRIDDDYTGFNTEKLEELEEEA